MFKSITKMTFFLSFLSMPLFASEFTLTSPNIREEQLISNDHVFNGFGCSGKNISPELKWSNPPEGTQSFAVTVYDPDAPTGSGWWHWVVFNIPATTRQLELNAGGPLIKKLPQGAIQSRTDFGKSGYGGPCPPANGTPHRYEFKVYALKKRLPIDHDATGAMAGFFIQQNKIAEASITGTYQRSIQQE